MLTQQEQDLARTTAFANLFSSIGWAKPFEAYTGEDVESIVEFFRTAGALPEWNNLIQLRCNCLDKFQEMVPVHNDYQAEIR